MFNQERAIFRGISGDFPINFAAQTFISSDGVMLIVDDAFAETYRIYFEVKIKTLHFWSTETIELTSFNPDNQWIWRENENFSNKFLDWVKARYADLIESIPELAERDKERATINIYNSTKESYESYLKNPIIQEYEQSKQSV